MTHDTFERFEALASRWDLDQPYRDLTDALDAAEEDSQAFVPSRLQEALHMCLDPYGRVCPPLCAGR